MSDEILERLGLRGAERLGAGGEAVVYAVDDETVVRIPRGAQPPGFAADRDAIQREIERDASRAGFAVPTIVRIERVLDREVTFERRLAGVDVDTALGQTDDPELRAAIVRNMLDATARIGDLRVMRSFAGELFGPDPLRAPTVRAFLIARLRRSLTTAGSTFAGVDAEEIVDALPIEEQPALVHFDAFSGNVLVDGTGVTAIIDFGPGTSLADRRLDPVLCAVYLDDAMTGNATEADRAVARSWLDDHGLASWYGPVRRFAAAYWSFARDDRELFRWCTQVLVRTDGIHD